MSEIWKENLHVHLEQKAWKVGKRCPKGETSMPTSKKEQNELFRENVPLREDYLRLKQKWT